MTGFSGKTVQGAIRETGRFHRAESLLVYVGNSPHMIKLLWIKLGYSRFKHNTNWPGCPSNKMIIFQSKSAPKWAISNDCGWESHVVTLVVYNHSSPRLEDLQHGCQSGSEALEALCYISLTQEHMENGLEWVDAGMRESPVSSGLRFHCFSELRQPRQIQGSGGWFLQWPP